MDARVANYNIKVYSAAGVDITNTVVYGYFPNRPGRYGKGQIFRLVRRGGTYVYDHSTLAPLQYLYKEPIMWQRKESK